MTIVIVCVLGMFFFVHFLPQVAIIKDLGNTNDKYQATISAKRTSPTHTYTTHLLPLQRDVSLFVLGSRQEGLKRSEDPWRAGENPTKLINEYRHPNSFKLPTQSRQW